MRRSAVVSWTTPYHCLSHDACRIVACRSCCAVVDGLRCGRRPVAGRHRRGIAAAGGRASSASRRRWSWLGAPLDKDAASRARQGAGQSATRPKRPSRFRPCSIRCAWSGVNINPESRVKVAAGQAAGQAVAAGASACFWSRCTTKAGVTAPLRVSSPNAAPLVKRSTRQPRPADLDQAERGRRPLARRGDARRPAAEQDALGLAARISADRALQPRRRPPRGEAGVRRRAGDAGPRLSQRGEPAVQLRAGRRGDAGSARRRRPADDRPLRVSRHARPRLSGACRGGWRPTSSSTSRSIATAARACCCRRASTT